MIIDNLVLGAGISGLACAHEMARMKKNVLICEAADHYGGLCHSFKIEEFCFDTAVHLSFTSNPIAREFFDKTQYQCHLPIAYNYYCPYWLKHPIINNLYPLPIDKKVQYLKSYIERREPKKISNYGEWLEASYGEKLARDFYYIYTRKYWTLKPEKLGTNWVGNRLNKPDIEKMLKGAFSSDTGMDYYAKEMRYPEGHNGYSTFLQPLISGVDIQYFMEAIEIDLENKYVKFIDGTIYHYNNLISSIPLPELIKRIKNVPKAIAEKAKALNASKISLVSVGFCKPDIPPYLWWYIYDEDILAARVNAPSIKSVGNVPKGCSSLQFEIYHNGFEEIDSEKIVENCKKALFKMKLCEEKDILFMDYRLIQYGNVIFDIGMEERRDCVKRYLAEKNVKLIGRFGEWDYLWSDQSYLSGIDCAHNSNLKI